MKAPPLKQGRFKFGSQWPLQPESMELGAIIRETLKEILWSADWDAFLSAKEPILGSWDRRAIKEAVWRLAESGFILGIKGLPLQFELSRQDQWAQIRLWVEVAQFPSDELSALLEYCRGHRLHLVQSRSELSENLSVVRAISEAHDGHLDVQEAPMHRVQIKVSLPLDSRANRDG